MRRRRRSLAVAAVLLAGCSAAPPSTTNPPSATATTDPAGRNASSGGGRTASPTDAASLIGTSPDGTPTSSTSTVGNAAARAGFVALNGMPYLVVDLRYNGSHNFVGRRVAGYQGPKALLTAQAAKALAGVAQALHAKGYGLIVYDAYRPRPAVADFYRWSQSGDISTKAEFYPHVAKADLYRLGYIATRSGHSRGSTVDLSLTDLQGRPIDMGSPFDLFDPASQPISPRITPDQQAHRNTLRDAMIRGGFRPLSTEWWHFSLATEPYPTTYFDFPTGVL